jgi:hypothetical protein
VGLALIEEGLLDGGERELRLDANHALLHRRFIQQGR